MEIPVGIELQFLSKWPSKVYRGNRSDFTGSPGNIYVLRIQCAVSYQLIEQEPRDREARRRNERRESLVVAGPHPSYRCDRIKTNVHQGEMYVRPDDPAAAGTVDLHR